MRYFAAPVVAALVVAALVLGVVIGCELGRRHQPRDGRPVSVPGELPLPGPVRNLLVATGFDRYLGQIDELNWYVGLYDTSRNVEIGGEAHYGPDGRRVANIVFGDAIGPGEAGVKDVCRRLVHEAAHFEYASYGDFYSDAGERYAQAIEAKFLAATATLDRVRAGRSVFRSAEAAVE